MTQNKTAANLKLVTILLPVQVQPLVPILPAKFPPPLEEVTVKKTKRKANSAPVVEMDLTLMTEIGNLRLRELKHDWPFQISCDPNLGLVKNVPHANDDVGSKHSYDSLGNSCLPSTPPLLSELNWVDQLKAQQSKIKRRMIYNNGQLIELPEIIV